jgi:DNA-binding transcriptional ArsR family regulator
MEFVHDAMPGAQVPRVRFVAGPAFETLIGLSALTSDDGALEPCSTALRDAIARVGERASELWLHLLGLALERPDDIVAAVRATSPLELRRHLAGVHVPAWRELVGTQALEATARGDDGLLDHDRYYAGRARPSLELLLPLSAAETKRRVLTALERYRAELLDAAAVAELEREAAAKQRLGADPVELIALAAPGYRYEPEPGLPDVVLVPHRAARPWLLLCQHGRTRIICYPLSSPQAAEDRLVALGRALGDEHRVRMLTRLREGDATLAELAQIGDVARSTAHHHLGLLRVAGLVEMRGNARGYAFSLLPEARRLLGLLEHHHRS